MTAAGAERPPKPSYPPFEGLPDIPALLELRERPHWLAWDYVWKEKTAKWDKPPLNARGGPGSTTDPATWSTYDQAALRAERDGLPGVGYALSPDVDDSGVDLDKCRDPETGALQAWAQVAVDFAETYTEISPSGRGLRFFVRGLVDGRKIDAAQVEIYTEGRYLTVTGRHVPGTPTEIRPAPRLIAYLQERADQFRAAQRAAADLAREAERKKAERRKTEAPRPERDQSTSERAAASARQRGPREGSDFWRTVNDRALANLSAWVTSIFPGARQSGNGAWRVAQSDLGEGYEEDLSLHPDGIRDFGCGDMGDARDGARSPIDIVQDYLPASDATAAAMWLCDRIGLNPESIGWRGGTRQDGDAPRAEGEQASNSAEEPAKPLFVARPFVWVDPARIPLRRWIMDRHLIRQFIAVMASPGGYGKSSLVIADALALVTGRNLIGHQPQGGPHRVLIWNGEDPLEEMERRVIAACLHFGIRPEEIEGRLFINSGRDDPITVATVERNGIKIAVPTVEAFTATLRANAIDAWFIDPFVSCHAVPENDNMMIDRVAKLFGAIAGVTNTAGELVHHTKKTGGAEVTMEDMRGAVALLSAARSGRILNGMTKDEAERAGVAERRLHFRVDNGKANLAPPPSEGSSWFQMQSVRLPNGGELGGVPIDGDSVGVVAAWQWPDPMKDLTTSDLRAAQAEVVGCTAAGARFRLNAQAKDWVGIPIARALKVDVSGKTEKARVGRILKTWIEAGMFAVVEGKDAKGMARDFVEVGTLATD